ncbi:MAG: hypothetical protein KatS3mg031_0359 [Chitinophagales bacterium]|nr:MAG: hypothetical protein KatS3mg031_0359 [Chitinophagales bacterium]
MAVRENECSELKPEGNPWRIYFCKLTACIADSNLLIASAALLSLYQTYLLLAIPLRPEPLGFFIFPSVFMLYHFHRLIAIPATDERQWSASQRWFMQNSFTAILMLMIAFFSALTCFILLPVKTKLALLPLAGLALAYSVPLLFLKHKRLRLRDFGIIKPFVIGGVWAGATVILPVIHFGVGLTVRDGGMLFLERFFFISALCVPFDIKDIAVDVTRIHKPTIAARWGVKTARQAGLLLLVCFFAITAGEWALRLPWMSGSVFAAYLLSFLITAVVLARVHESRNEHYYTVCIDGTIIIQALLILLMK